MRLLRMRLLQRLRETTSMQVLYGPPPTGHYVCDACGQKWLDQPDGKTKRCPKCRKKTIRLVEPPDATIFEPEEPED